MKSRHRHEAKKAALMTLPPAEDREFCPICGGILKPVDNSLYCATCDLVYEASHDHDHDHDHDEHSG